jgi:hypothetical protein
MQMNVTRVRYTSEENNFKKWFKRPKLRMTLFSLAALRLGLCYFLVTLLALLIFLNLTNTDILGMMGLKT